MIVKVAQSVTVFFSTNDAATGETTSADVLPTATLYENGADSGEVITITNILNGLYSASFATPADASEEDVFDLTVEATVNGITGRDSVWRGTVIALGAGSGAITFTYTLTEAPEGVGDPIADAEVVVFTDAAMATTPVASGRTDAFGQVVFYLDAGTYYLRRRKAGYSFSPQPDTEVVA